MRRAALCLTLSILFTACGHQAEAQPVSSRPTTLSSPVSSSCDRACWLERIEQQRNERLWWSEVVKQQKAAAAYRRLLAFAAAVERAKREARPASGYCTIEGVRVCDGPGLLPFRIVWRESRMQGHVRNRSSSAGGYAQVLIGTLRSVCPTEAARYGNAAYMPVGLQVECVRRLIARHGLRPWGG